MVEVFLFCGLGALVRYALRPLNDRYCIPLGTLLANLWVGLAIGYLSGQSALAAPVRDWLLYALGGLGTYSTLTKEVLTMRREPGRLTAYLIVTYGLGVLAVFAGQALAG